MRPHKSQYWLNLEPDPQRESKITALCALYQAAPDLATRGERVLSTDEKTGIQALERKHPTQAMKVGRLERQEFEYVRHGTQCLMANLEVLSGKLYRCSVTDTRTEADFAAHLAQTVQHDPHTLRWHVVVDGLNTHASETLVRWVAQRDGLDIDLGKKGQAGILKSMASRAAFLSDPSHSVVLYYTPKHASWMNQAARPDRCRSWAKTVEVWFSILVRKLLKRSSWTSSAALKGGLLDFIAYFNATLARPLRWTFGGKPLSA